MTATTPRMTALSAGVCAFSQQRLFGVVSEPLGVGAGGELVDGTGQSAPGLARSRVESARRCAQSAVSQNLS